MRKLAGWGVAVAVVASLVIATPAQALAPSLRFTADNLPTWQTNGTVWGMASAQGKVFAGGSFSQVRPPGTAEGSASSLNRSQLVVLDAATGTPTSCVLAVTRGTAAAIVRSVVASPDKNTVYIGGLFDKVGTDARKNIASIDVATCKVNPFNPQPSSFVYAIAVTSSSVYFGGTFAAVGASARSRLAAATPAGALLQWAPTTDDETLALAVDPSGSGNVIVGGRSGTMNGQDSNALAVVDGVTGKTNVHNYPGLFPRTPGTGQRTGTSAVKTIAVDGTGFYVGNEGTGSGVFDGRSAFNWGTYVQRWQDNCLGATQALVPINGVLYAGDHAHNCESENTFEDGQRHFFNAESTADKKSQPWWPQANDGIGEGIGPRSMTLASTASGDYLWAGGEFTQINGVAQRGLARFGQAPDTGAPVTPATPNVLSLASGQATVTWRTTTDNDDKTLTYTLYRGTSTTPIATLQADSQFYIRPQLSFTDIGLTPGSTVSYRVKASDGTNTSAFSVSRSVTVASSTAAYPAKIRADGASVYFRMEDPNGSAAGSLGGGPLGGSYVNASTRAGQAGALLNQPGQSALFDGTSSFLRTEVRTQAPTIYSIETWFKTTTARGGKLVGYGNRVDLNSAATVPLSSVYDRQIYMTNDGRVMFGVNPGTKVTLTSAAGLNNGQWHQVVATQGSSGMALYVDGVRVAANTTTGAQSYQGYWRIGGDNLTSWANRPLSNFFAGNIDETAIYSAALSATQVADHYRLSGRTLPTALAAAQAPQSPAGLTAKGADAADAPDVAGQATAASPQALAAVAAPVDGQAPTAPAGVTATFATSSVSLAWSPSTDNVAVTGYEVYRSATSGFAPSAATRVGSVPGTSFMEPAPSGGTWFYRVVALDAAGNASAASVQLSAVLSAPTPTTQASTAQASPTPTPTPTVQVPTVPTVPTVPAPAG